MTTQQVRRTPLQAYTEELWTPGVMADLRKALPAHIPPERFIRNVSNVLMQKPELMQHDARLIWRECAKAAALGLVLDPHLGECYMVEVYDGRAKKKVPQLRIGYRGKIKLMRQSGEIAKVNVRAVHENDVVDAELGVEERFSIKVENLFADRGAVLGYVAFVHYKDGEVDFEPMSLSEIYAIRDRSDAWKAYKAGFIKTTPWLTDEGEMAKKTVLHRIAKRTPMSADIASALAQVDAAEEAGGMMPEAAPRAARMRQGPTIDGDVEEVAEQSAAAPAAEAQEEAQDGSQEAQQDDPGEDGGAPEQGAAQEAGGAPEEGPAAPADQQAQEEPRKPAPGPAKPRPAQRTPAPPAAGENASPDDLMRWGMSGDDNG